MYSKLLFNYFTITMRGFLGGSMIKNLPANAEGTGDTGLIAQLGRALVKGDYNPLQYSCLGKYGQRSLTGYNPCGCKESDTA